MGLENSAEDLEALWKMVTLAGAEYCVSLGDTVGHCWKLSALWRALRGPGNIMGHYRGNLVAEWPC